MRYQGYNSLKIGLKLSSGIWNAAGAKKAFSRVVRKNTLELQSGIKRSMSDSVPSGKLYRRGRVTRAATKALKREGFRQITTPKGKQRVIVGYSFHRASAPGQVPAIDTGKYANSIEADVSLGNKGIVGTNAVQAAFLESTRPHFAPALQKQKPKLLADAQTTLKNLINK